MFQWLSDLVSGMLDWIYSLLPFQHYYESLQQLQQLIPPQISYFLYFFGFDYVLPAVLAAYIVRFLIRRIPFIG